MENDLKMVQKLKKMIIETLEKEFGYCGMAETKEKNCIYLNSGKAITVRIEAENE